MSQKTKAELEAENQMLRSENQMLRKKWKQRVQQVRGMRRRIKDQQVLIDLQHEEEADSSNRAHLAEQSNDAAVKQVVRLLDGRREVWDASRSEIRREAVNVKHSARWPDDKKAALKRDYLKMRPDYSSDYAFCRAYAVLIFNDGDNKERKKKWRQIQTQLRNLELVE